MAPDFDYPFELRPLQKEEGGGWLIVFPDLPGCMSDGETPEEAIANGRDAVSAWMKAAKEAGREISRPGELPSGGLLPASRAVCTRGLRPAPSKRALA
jgi:antitoxin HicB